MPWTAKSARRHTRRANTRKRKRQWAHVANKTRARLLRKGVGKKRAEARAVRAANRAVKR